MPDLFWNLVRDTYSREMGTFGTLSVWEVSAGEPNEKLIEVETVERPWANNMPYISCIPEGMYAVSPRRFYRGGYDSWEVRDVPGRSNILIHRGNTPSDVQGCIAVGRRRGVLEGRWAVLDSVGAFTDLSQVVDLRVTEGALISIVISRCAPAILPEWDARAEPPTPEP